MAALPRPGVFSSAVNKLKGLKVLLISDAKNSFTNRVEQTLIWLKAEVDSVATRKGKEMISAVNHFNPEIIVCPFLTARVPEAIWSKKERPCLIVHPGIAGDRSLSAIDLALLSGQSEWGVTVLQAVKEMDTGDIWSTSDYPVEKDATKTSLYVGQFSDAAVSTVLDALCRFQYKIPPTPLDYNHPEVKGCLQRTLTDADRIVDWTKSAEDVLRMIRMSDTQPGAVGEIFHPSLFDGVFRLFDGHMETGESSEAVRTHLSACEPGEIVGKKNQAVLVKTGDGKGVWIGCMKRNKSDFPELKLPATLALPKQCAHNVDTISGRCDYNNIWIQKDDSICYVHFDFYNGAMDKHGCGRLEQVLEDIAKMEDIKLVALMGGDRFFSTGIHLSVIEGSENREQEAQENINKIDDLIKRIAMFNDKMTVAVLQGNAGAGGVMMAAAADIVITHPGTLLTHSYENMHLFGSEYWTSFFPRRDSSKKAYQLIYNEELILAERAKDANLVDFILGGNKAEFRKRLPDFLKYLRNSEMFEETLRKKQFMRNNWQDILASHQKFEIHHMRKNFRSREFEDSLRKFVSHLEK
ncbi:hypothetical protein CHS0354_012543 [Potamilus streckersoni]|uniref:Uncharacterized protein n=1 Tax=Potamilus streckersoni TaxID=2493646 RepID=A0AAE0S2C0_9BIVA|nr:hypothetical protein CHS0354_012543 [Potamilus streckersoni]